MTHFSTAGSLRPALSGRGQYLFKLASLLVLLSLGAGRVQAQAPAWQATQAIAQLQDGKAKVYGTALNAAGDVFVTGAFTEQAGFGSTVLTSKGSNDAFVAKWSATSQSWVWAVAGGGTGDDRSTSIALDGSDVYITGAITNTSANASSVQFGGTALNGASGISSDDVFVARYTDAGSSATFSWATVGGGTTADQGNGIAVNSTGVYVGLSTGTGTPAGNATFGSLPPVPQGRSGFGQLDAATGTWQAAAFNQSGRVQVLGLALNAVGDVFLTGGLYSATSFGSAALTSVGGSDAFVAKWSTASQTWTWAVAGGGTQLDQSNAIVVSGSNVYITGTFQNTSTNVCNAQFGGVTLDGICPYNSGSLNDVFLAKYTDAGSSAIFGWATAGGGYSMDEGLGLAVSGTGVYITGGFVNDVLDGYSAKIGNSKLLGVSLVAQVITSPTDIYVAKFTDNGSSYVFDWAKAGGGQGGDFGTALAVRGGTVYVGLHQTEGNFRGGPYGGFGSLPRSIGNTGGFGQLDAATGTWQAVNLNLRGGTSQVNASAVNAAGDVLVVGTYLGQARFGSTLLTSTGGQDAFIAKWSTATQSWAWATTGGGALNDNATAIAVSGTSLYVKGRFTGSTGNATEVMFGGFPVYGQLAPAYIGPTTGYVVKYTDAGSSVVGKWAVRETNSWEGAIAANGSSVYQLDLSQLTKYTDTGSGLSKIWSIASSSNAKLTANSLITDGAAVYMAGTFTNSSANANNVTIGGITLNGASSATSDDVFVVKCTDAGSSGTVNWAVSGGGTGPDQGTGLAVSGSSVYVTGAITNTSANASSVQFGGTALNGASSTSSTDVFVAKYTDAGSSATYNWATAGGGSGADQGTGLAVSGSSVYVTGAITNTSANASSVQFGGTALNGASSTSSTDVFVAKYTDAGSSATYNWATAGGGSGPDQANSLVLNGSSLYVSGYAALPATFGPLQLPGATNQVAILAALPAPANLVISTGTMASPTGVPAGMYNSITVAGTGNAILSGGVTVNSSFEVQAGGTLNTNCQALTGAGSFTLAAGATLSICDAAGLTASGSTGAVQVAGSHTFSPDASYVYNGTTAQVTGDGLPGEVRALTTSNSNALTLIKALAVRQTLTLAGTGNLNTNGQALTLLSNAAGTALVVNAGNGTVSGDVTVQRYIDGTLNPSLGYRHLVVPVLGATVAAFGSGGATPVVNSAYNTAANPSSVTPFPTVYYYDQSRLASSPATTLSAFDKGWASPTSLSSPAQLAFQGFTVQLPGASTLSFSGQVGNGNGTIALSRNSGTTTADAGWNFIGNPYPSPLDLSTVTTNQRTNVDAAFYTYESTSQYGGSYRSYINGIGNPLLGSSQAFFVRVSAGQTSGSLNLTNANRVTDYARQAPVRRSAADPRPQLQLTLAGQGLSDALTLYAEAPATAGFDKEFDAAKRWNPNGLSLATLAASGEALAIDGRPAFPLAQPVPLTLQAPRAGHYTLTATDLANLPAGTAVTLVDLSTGTRTPLSAGTTYSLTLPAGSTAGRLQLEGAAAPLATAGTLAAQLGLYPNPTTDGLVQLVRPTAWGSLQVQLLNSIGQTLLSTRLAAGEPTLDVRALPTGVYTLRLTTQDGQTLTKRLVRQ